MYVCEMLGTSKNTHLNKILILTFYLSIMKYFCSKKIQGLVNIITITAYSMYTQNGSVNNVLQY